MSLVKSDVTLFLVTLGEEFKKMITSVDDDVPPVPAPYIPLRGVLDDLNWDKPRNLCRQAGLP